MIVLRAMHRCRGMFAVVRRWMPLFLEAAVTLASIRMAALLFVDQGYFEKYHNFYFWLLAHFPNEEWKWALLASAAATLKGVGMLLMFFQQRENIIETAFVLRGLGWAISVVFWSTFGLSIQIGDAWSLGSITCAALAQLSLAALVMGPAMPEAPHDRYEG